MYILKRINNIMTIQYMEYDNPYYEFDLISNLSDRINVNSIKVYNKHIIDALFKLNQKNTIIQDINVFKMNLNKLITITMQYLYFDSDDSSDDNIAILLGEVDKLRAELELHLKNHLKIEEYKDFLTKLIVVKKELEIKLSYNNSLEEEKETKVR